MKSIIKSFLIIVAVAAIAGGSTLAIFSAQDSIPGNTISSGTVTIDVHNFSGDKPINEANMVPGAWTPNGRAEIYNTGSLPVKVWMYATNLDGALCGDTNLEMKTGHAGGDEFARTVLNAVDLTAIDSPAERVEVTGVPPFANLGANITQVVNQRAQLDPAATAQGASCTWEEVFVAESLL